MTSPKKQKAKVAKGNTGTLATQNKYWCFTSFDIEMCLKPKPNSFITYIIGGLETCPETKKQHIQGYLECSTKRTINAIKKELNCQSMHLEQRRGSQEEAINYCKKDGNIMEFGIKSENTGQGKRTDLIEYKKAVKDGKSEFELMENHYDTWIRYDKLSMRIREAQLDNTKKPMPTVIVFHGETGKGKSMLAHLIAEYYCSDPYRLTGNTKWWDGYKGQDCIIMDDYEGDMTEKHFLQLTDRYKFRAEIKGGFTYIIASLIFITCNDIDWIIHGTKQLQRRISQLIKIE